MSESNNNTPMRITQLEEATSYPEGAYLPIAKAGYGTKKILVGQPSIPDLNILNNSIDDQNYFYMNDLLSDSDYTYSANGQDTYVSNKILEAKTYIKSFRIMASSNSNGLCYILDASNNKVIYKKVFAMLQGWNEISINYILPANAKFAIRGNFKFRSGQGLIYNQYNFWDGVTIQQGETNTEYNIGDIIPITTPAVTTFFAFAVQLKMSHNLNVENIEKTGLIEELKIPKISDKNCYLNTSGLTNYYICKRIIKKGSYIKNIRLYMGGGQSANLILINKENKIVSFSNYTPESSTDFNVIPVGIYANEDVFFGIRGNIHFVQNNLTPDEYTLNTDGLYEVAASSVGVGNTVTINKTSSDRYCFAFQLEVESPIETKANFENVSEAIQENNVSTSWLPKGLQLEPSSLRYRNISEKFGLVGRWYKQTVNNLICNVTNNCGSEIFLRAIAIGSAAKIVINWQAMTETNAYYTYSIDGGEMTRKIISENEISIPAGMHNIRIVTDGITENIGKWQNGTGFAFSGIESEACFIGGILPKNPQIMFFGDSITEGIRALGVTTGDMGDTNSATGAFPWFTCLKLGAVSHRVGYGASGITVNGSFHKADDALKYLYSQLYVPTYYPDAIVINHGTNDGSASANDFRTAYNQFLKDIKAIYSGVRVFVMIPFNQAHAATIRTIVSENEGVYLIETSSWTGIEKADGTHPTKAGAEVAGNYLANAMIDLIYG